MNNCVSRYRWAGCVPYRGVTIDFHEDLDNSDSVLMSVVYSFNGPHYFKLALDAVNWIDGQLDSYRGKTNKGNDHAVISIHHT